LPTRPMEGTQKFARASNLNPLARFRRKYR